MDTLHGDTDAQFAMFENMLNKATEQCIPLVNTEPYFRHCRPPMDANMRKLVRRKNRLWTRYMETKDIHKYKEFCKCRNKVRSYTRKARRTFELRVAERAFDEPKNFWNYAKSKLKTLSRIPDLYKNNDNTNLTENDYDKVEVLSDFFASVYTARSNDALPELRNEHMMYEMEVPEINSSIVENLLLT